MNPLRVRATSFRSFPDLDITLDDGLIGILGELRDAPDGADSNGAGKSSILTAIDVALFGPEGRTLAPYVTRGELEMTLVLDLEDAGTVYRIRRSCSVKGRGKQTLDIERETGAGFEPLTRESAKETQQLIERTLGLTRRTFRDSCLLVQGDGSIADPARTPAERMTLLVEAVFGRDPIWPRAQEAAKKDRKAAEAERQRLDGETAAAREIVSSKELLVAEHTRREVLIDQHTGDLAAAEGRLAELTERHAQAREQAANRAAALAELDAARAAAAQADRAAAQAAQAADAIEVATLELATLATAEQWQQAEAENSRHRGLAQARAAATAEREALRGEAGRIAAERERLGDEILRLEDRAADLFGHAGVVEQAPGEPCDRCGTPLHGDAAARAAASYRAEAAQLQQRTVELNAQISGGLYQQQNELAKRAAAIEIPDVDPDAARAAEELAARARKDQQTHAALDERIRAAQALIDASDGIDEQAAAARALVVEKQAALDELEPVDAAAVLAELLQVKARVAGARDLLDRVRDEKARLEERLARVTEAEQRITAAQERAADVDRDASIAAACERMFGRDGIPALIVENVAIPSIEAEATRILGELGTCYRVELRTQAELKDGSGLRDTLEIVVIDDSGEAPFETFSGGEQTRINLALRIALAGLLASRRGAESQLLALDEPSFLDAAGMAALVDVLARLPFRKKLLVSHVPDLRDSVDSVIAVVKENGRSRILGADREQVPA